MDARWLCPLALLLAGPLQAASVLKCVDATGNVTFTQKVCPGGYRLERQLEVVNEAPRGSGAPVLMAEPPPPAPIQAPAPVVVAPPRSVAPPPLPPPRDSSYIRSPDLPYYPPAWPSAPMWHHRPPPPPKEPPPPPPPAIRGMPTRD
ncbi:hypothetical protein [Pseudomonas mangiferae]|uniref:DUF4124 domain-containing protein n=1 Tax=Pseudomonas mangiferae TaxID=2593654 RepID=A0A553GYP6_9PSED|nr:hypothetical protein [Pseudomonas mangiferae]TRX74627.1 hypothetical protein FM069_11505 [Pseudomonas mangiferae]